MSWVFRRCFPTRLIDVDFAVIRSLGTGVGNPSFLDKGLSVTYASIGPSDPDDTAMATFLLSVMGAFAEFERALIRERQREGITLAKKAGVYKGRGKMLSAEKESALIRRAAAGEAKVALAREFGISRQTVYQYLQQK